jgi:hypothetical protein
MCVDIEYGSVLEGFSHFEEGKMILTADEQAGGTEEGVNFDCIYYGNEDGTDGFESSECQFNYYGVEDEGNEYDDYFVCHNK